MMSSTIRSYHVLFSTSIFVIFIFFLPLKDWVDCLESFFSISSLAQLYPKRKIKDAAFMRFNDFIFIQCIV